MYLTNHCLFILQSVINNEVSHLSVNSELYITASEYAKYYLKNAIIFKISILILN